MRKLALLAVLAIASGAAFAEEPKVPALMATEAQTRSSLLVYGLFSDSRYTLHPIDVKSAGAELLDLYLKALDEERLYLEARDVEELARNRDALGQGIMDKDLSAVFAVYQRFRQRADERLARVPGLVASVQDFSRKESIASKPERWQDASDLDARWRLKIKAELLELRLADVPLESARSLVLQRYAATAKQLHAMGSAEVVETFLDALARAGHPGQNYMAPLTAAQADRVYNIDPLLVGVGMLLRREGVYSVVSSLTPGGSAAASGQLHQGDRLYGIFEQGQWTDLIGRRLEYVIEHLRGESGSRLKLRVRSPDGVVRVVELVRDKVALQEEGARREAVDVGGVAIDAIRLPGFYLDFEAARRGEPNARSASHDVARLIGEAKARGAKGLVLDLRGNGGGALTEAIDVAGLFLGKKPVLQVREGGGKISIESGKQDAVWTGPLVVLVDEQSAAASEIVAGALQDSGRALVVGQRTFGRGSIQNLIDLDRVPSEQGPQYGQAKITVAEVFRPGGASIEPAIEPDVVFDEPMPSEGKIVGPSRKMPPASGYSAAPALPVAKLVDAHQARVGQDPGFQAWIAARAALRSAALAKSISLNETERRNQASAVGPVIAAGYRPEVRDAPLRAAVALLAGLVE